MSMLSPDDAQQRYATMDLLQRLLAERLGIVVAGDDVYFHEDTGEARVRLSPQIMRRVFRCAAPQRGALWCAIHVDIDAETERFVPLDILAVVAECPTCGREAMNRLNATTLEAALASVYAIGKCPDCEQQWKASMGLSWKP